MTKELPDLPLSGKKLDKIAWELGRSIRSITSANPIDTEARALMKRFRADFNNVSLEKDPFSPER